MNPRCTCGDINTCRYIYTNAVGDYTYEIHIRHSLMGDINTCRYIHTDALGDYTYEIHIRLRLIIEWGHTDMIKSRIFII